MEGLEITVCNWADFTKDNAYIRLDSEYQDKERLEIVNKLKGIGAERFGEGDPVIVHPHEITRSYVGTEGVWFFRAQNIRPMSINSSNKVFISIDDAESLSRNALKNGDVVITRTGANAGDCALFSANETVLASSHTFIVRAPYWSHYYLVTFLNTNYGRRQILSSRYGAAQPEVSPYYLRNIWIPRFNDDFYERIERCFLEAERLKNSALSSLEFSESILLRALGLNDWHAPEPLTYVRSSHDAFSAGRLDAEYFTPRVTALLKQLGRDHLTIADVAPARHEKFKTDEQGDTFRYIEIGSVNSDGMAEANEISTVDAPSRASQYVKRGDVITSTVRPIRRLSALVTEEHDGDVCSSGFVVLQPRKISGPTLLTYLKLPPVCELMDLHTSASLYPAISEKDLLALPIPRIPEDIQKKIDTKVEEARSAKQRAIQLLDAAKRAVEIAIEQDEKSALAFLESYS